MIVPTNLAYILAASHSGSTLLAMLLNAHRRVCTVGELKATNMGDLDRYRCSCGSPIRRCGFWRTVGERMAQRGYRFDLESPGTDFAACPSGYARRLLEPLHRGPIPETVRETSLAVSSRWRRHLEATSLRNAALAEVICSIRGAAWIVDSSKVALRLKYLLRNPDLNVKVIRLIRDGRGVALTYMDPARFADAANPDVRGGGMGGDRQAERQPMSRAAWQWRRSNEEAQALTAGLEPSDWLQVRYEDLCGDPAGVTERVLGFLGVPGSISLEGFRLGDHHVVGNGMRLDTSTEILLDERWRSVLDREQLGAFDAVAGKLNRSYGYAPAG